MSTARILSQKNARRPKMVGYILPSIQPCLCRKWLGHLLCSQSRCVNDAAINCSSPISVGRPFSSEVEARKTLGGFAPNPLDSHLGRLPPMGCVSNVLISSIKLFQVMVPITLVLFHGIQFDSFHRDFSSFLVSNQLGEIQEIHFSQEAYRDIF